MITSPFRYQLSTKTPALVFLVASWHLALPLFAQNFSVERITGNYNQPVYLTQSPGDDNSLYILERVDAGTSNEMGRIVKLDQQSNSSTTFLDLSGTVANEGGLIAMAFDPGFETNGKFYVSLVDNAVNRIEEYQVVAGTPQFSRTLLEYSNFSFAVHTVDWLGFRPGGMSTELFVTTGDGGHQANDAAFDPALIESTNSPYSKLLKLDLAGDFTTPVGAGLDADSRVDVVANGLRNPWRASFDSRGGMFIGDVGYLNVEEVNYIHADVFDNPPATPLNFGWTDREGTIPTIATQAGGPKAPGDIDPI